jgi:hypothetical protein
MKHPFIIRFAKLVGSVSREPPSNFENFRRTSYPDFYNIFRELLYLFGTQEQVNQELADTIITNNTITVNTTTVDAAEARSYISLRVG